MSANEPLDRAECKLASGLITKASRELGPLLSAIDRGEASPNASDLLRLARALRRVAQYEELVEGKEKKEAFLSAGRVLNKAIKGNPYDASLIYERGILLFCASEFARSIVEFNWVIDQADAQHLLLAFEGASACHRRRYEPEQAKKQIDKAAVQFANTAVAVSVERAWLDYDASSHAKALHAFEKVLEAYPNNESALVGRFCCQQAMGNREGADKSLEALPESLSGEQGLVLLGQCVLLHYEAVNHDAQLIAVEQMIRLDEKLAPDKGDSHLHERKAYLLEMKVDVLRDLGLLEAAEKFCTESMKLFPDHVGLKMELGYVYYYQRRNEDAHRIFSDTKQFEDLNASELKKAKASEWASAALRRLNRNEEAKKWVNEALARFPDAVGLWGEMGILLYAEHEYERAIQAFDRALAAEPTDEFALQWRIASHRKLDKFDRAFELAKEALSLLPRSPFLCSELGWLFTEQDNLEKAEAAFRRAVELGPNFADFWFARAEALVRLGRRSEVDALLEKVKERFATDESWAERLGLFYLSQDEPFKARSVFQSMLKRVPDSAPGINGMGGFDLDQQDYKSAEAHFRLAIDRVDHEPKYRINLAWSLLRQANETCYAPGFDPVFGMKVPQRTIKELLRESEESCMAALTLDRFSAKAMECLGVIAFTRGHFLEAEDYFRCSIRWDRRQGSHVDLGALYAQMGRHEEAEKKFDEALKLNNNDVQALLEIANLRLAKGEFGRSALACQHAVHVAPNNEDGHRAWAVALIREGKWTEAELILRKGIARLDERRGWKLRLMLSRVLVALGDDNNRDRTRYEEALQQVNAARRIKGLNEEVHFHAGIVYVKLEDFANARKSFEDCVKANPQRFDAERNARLIQQRVREIRRVNRVNYWGGLSLAVICMVSLLFLWVLYLLDTTAQVKSNLITFMTPLLLGLTIVSLLLPNLNKLKLPGGFEAQISVPGPRDISSGPKGDIGFSNLSEPISRGPQ